VSVCGTVTDGLARGFSGRMVRPVGLALKPRFLLAQILNDPADFPTRSDPDEEHELPTVVRCPSLRVPPSLITDVRSAGISTGQPSPTPLHTDSA
jgi:hypothetical protein